MIRNLASGIGLAAALLLAACSGEEAKVNTAPDRVPVRVVEIGSSQSAAIVKVVGTAAWRKETPLGFTSGGQIERILVNEGDRIRPGQLLARLRTTPIAAELTAAQAEATRAEAELGRIRKLFTQGWVTKARLEAAEAAARGAGAAVEARRFALDTARVTAPSGGVILARLAEPNQVVAAGTPVLVLGEAGAGYVLRAPINDRIAATLTPGMPATVRFEALAGTVLEGRIVEVGARADRTTGTFAIEIALPSDPRLKSGMIGTAEIVGGGTAAVRRLMVPSTALLSPRAGEAVIYVLTADNRVARRTVQIGEATDGGVEVLGGLQAGERVAVSNLDRLRDKAAVAPSQTR